MKSALVCAVLLVVPGCLAGSRGDPDGAAVDADAAEVVEDTAEPATDTVVEDTVDPAPDAVVEDTVDPAPDAVVEDTVDPAPDTVVEDTVDPAPDTVVEDTVDPAPDTVVEDTVDPAPDTVVEDTVAPAPDTVVEDTVDPAPDTVVEDTFAPVDAVEDVVDTVDTTCPPELYEGVVPGACLPIPLCDSPPAVCPETGAQPGADIGEHCVITPETTLVESGVFPVDLSTAPGADDNTCSYFYPQRHTGSFGVCIGGWGGTIDAYVEPTSDAVWTVSIARDCGEAIACKMSGETAHSGALAPGFYILTVESYGAGPLEADLHVTLTPTPWDGAWTRCDSPLCVPANLAAQRAAWLAPDTVLDDVEPTCDAPVDVWDFPETVIRPLFVRDRTLVRVALEPHNAGVWWGALSLRADCASDVDPLCVEEPLDFLVLDPGVYYYAYTRHNWAPDAPDALELLPVPPPAANVDCEHAEPLSIGYNDTGQTFFDDPPDGPVTRYYRVAYPAGPVALLIEASGDGYGVNGAPWPTAPLALYASCPTGAAIPSQSTISGYWPGLPAGTYWLALTVPLGVTPSIDVMLMGQ